MSKCCTCGLRSAHTTFLPGVRKEGKRFGDLLRGLFRAKFLIFAFVLHFLKDSFKTKERRRKWQGRRSRNEEAIMFLFLYVTDSEDRDREGGLVERSPLLLPLFATLSLSCLRSTSSEKR